LTDQENNFLSSVSYTFVLDQVVRQQLAFAFNGDQSALFERVTEVAQDATGFFCDLQSKMVKFKLIYLLFINLFIKIKLNEIGFNFKKRELMRNLKEN
jgi:hypothetical protein